jgi:hypothetical protein
MYKALETGTRRDSPPYYPVYESLAFSVLNPVHQ